LARSATPDSNGNRGLNIYDRRKPMKIVYQIAIAIGIASFAFATNAEPVAGGTHRAK
jgi:hypothetical protein